MAWGIPKPALSSANDWRYVIGYLREVYNWVLQQQQIVTITAAYTVPETVHHVRVNATGGAITVTVPAASTRDGRSIRVTKTDSSANAVTIARTGSDTFNAATSISLATQYHSIELISNGVSQWDVEVSPAAFGAAHTGNVAFPATQVADAGANVLDDYEEGTYTPNVGGSASYTAQSGVYTKTGRSVDLSFYMAINAIGTGSTTLLSGAPFANGSATSQTGSIAYFASIQHPVYFLGCYINASAATIAFTDTTNTLGSTTTAAAVVVFQNAAAVQGAITYTAAT